MFVDGRGGRIPTADPRLPKQIAIPYFAAARQGARIIAKLKQKQVPLKKLVEFIFHQNYEMFILELE